MTENLPLNIELFQQDLPIYQCIRKRIDSFQISELLKNPAENKENEFKMVLKIIYLFGGESGEIIGSSNKTNPIKGNDFYQTSIGNEEAIVLSIPTNRKAARYRDIALPLNPMYEKWTKEIIEYTEKKGDNDIWSWTYENLRGLVSKIFFLEMPISIYEGKADKTITSRKLTLKSLREIRLLELGLCHNFNEFEFKHFCGDITAPDYNVYFNKLLNKCDFYNKKDVYSSLELKNIIFSPKGSDKYNYKDYMKIVKKINRGYIVRGEVNTIKIDETLDIKDIISPQSGEKKHKILMKNAEKEIRRLYGEKVVDVNYETANLDVVAEIKKDDSNNETIIVECGDSYAHKLLEAFNNVYSDVTYASQFWVLNYGDEKTRKAEYYKFYKKENYR